MTRGDTPIRAWLQDQRELNELHLEIMTLWYDLDGARAAAQTGVAWWAQQRLLIAVVRLTVRAAGVPVPAARDELEQAFLALAALGRINPAARDDAWDLWLRPAPTEAQLGREVERTLRYITRELQAPWAATRHGAVEQWAASTRMLRSVAQKLGIGQDSGWYLSAFQEPEPDWYHEVLSVLASEREGGATAREIT